MKMASGPSLSACPQARFHPRLINAAEADPYSRAAGIRGGLAEALKDMRQGQHTAQAAAEAFTLARSRRR